MKEPSTLGFALLGLLAREPHSGYELASLMKQRVRYFWTAQHSQIYPELAKLEEAGFVTHDVERQAGRPDRKVFAVTKEGRTTLARWVEQPIGFSATRDEAILKVYCGPSADPNVLAANLESYATELDAVVAALEENRAMMETKFERELHNTKSGKFFGWATLTLGIDATRVRAKWCRSVAKQIASGDTANAQPRSKPRKK